MIVFFQYYHIGFVIHPNCTVLGSEVLLVSGFEMSLVPFHDFEYDVPCVFQIFFWNLLSCICVHRILKPLPLAFLFKFWCRAHWHLSLALAPLVPVWSYIFCAWFQRNMHSDIFSSDSVNQSGLFLISTLATFLADSTTYFLSFLAVLMMIVWHCLLQCFSQWSLQLGL